MTGIQAIAIYTLRLLAAVVLFLVGLTVVCVAGFIGAYRLAARAERAHRRLQERLGGQPEVTR